VRGVVLVLAQLHAQARPRPERGLELEIAVDQPLPRGEAALLGSERLRGVLPLGAPRTRGAGEEVIEQALVVLFLLLDIEGRELLGAGAPRTGSQAQRERQRD